MRSFRDPERLIKALAKNFEIHTASGNPSWVVETLLSGMGVRELIGKPFGSDLVGYPKGHRTFHVRILKEVGALPEDSIVVDDDDSPLLAARKLGAKTVKVGGAGLDHFDLTIGSLSELPDAILKVTMTRFCFDYCPAHSGRFQVQTSRKPRHSYVGRRTDNRTSQTTEQSPKP